MKALGDGWLYARKSDYHGKRGSRGRSVAEQLDEGTDWCDTNGVRVAGQYVDDDRSASPFASQVREDFEEMIADIASGKIKRGDVVVAWESSRLHRDLEVYVQIRKACWDAGVYWCLNGRLFDLSDRQDRKVTGYAAVDAEDQAYEISERVRRSMRANARKGRPHGVPLYGYTRSYDPGSGDLVEVTVNEAEAVIVRELFTRVIAHHPLAAILRDLSDRQVPSPSGSCVNTQVGAELREQRERAGLDPGVVAETMRWRTRRLHRVEAGTWGLKAKDLHQLCDLYAVTDDTRARIADCWAATPQWTIRAQIHSIVTNPAYIGRRTHKGEDMGAAIWPAIVDEATFRAAGAILADPARRTQRDTRLTNLLSGLARCGVEGCEGIARSATHHRGYRVYRCQPGRHFVVRAERLEQFVVAHLVVRLSQPDAAEFFAVARDNDAEMARLEADIARWEKELADGESLVEAGAMTMKRLANVEARLAPKIAAANRQMGQLRVNPLLAELIHPDAERVFAAWNDMGLSQKRAALRAVADIVVSPVGSGRRNVNLDDHVVIKWRRGG